MTTLLACSLSARAARAQPQHPPVSELGLPPPGARLLPERHSFRLAVTLDYIRLSALRQAGESTGRRYHFFPVGIEPGYQLQFARIMAWRVAAGFALNAANSRHAMRMVFSPRTFVGLQGRMFGLMAGYGLLVPFPVQPNVSTGQPNTGPEPAITANQALALETSLTSRIDRVSMTWALGISAVHSKLTHGNAREHKGWRPMFSTSFGVVVDRRTVQRRRRERAQREPEL